MNEPGRWPGLTGQRQMIEAGVCALFYRLEDNTPVMCGYDTPCPKHMVSQWVEEAEKIVAAIEKYEYEHPHVNEGAPCLGNAMEEAKRAILNAKTVRPT